MSYSLYGSWTIEEAENVGKEFIAKCHANYSYEDVLKKDKEYKIKITPRILPMSPLCEGIGENGKKFECHLERFTKISEVKNEITNNRKC